MCEEIFKGGSFNPTSPYCFDHTLTTAHNNNLQLLIQVCHSNQYETSIRNVRTVTDLHSRSPL